MDATTVTTGVEWHFIHRRSAVFDFMGCNEYACRAIDELDVLDRGANYYCGRGVGGWVSSPPAQLKMLPAMGTAGISVAVMNVARRRPTNFDVVSILNYILIRCWRNIYRCVSRIELAALSASIPKCHKC
jgi:hypothetical protein